MAPLVGAGARSDALEARIFAGPRLTLAGNSPFIGAQVTGDLSWGVERAALYFPVTLAWIPQRGKAAEFSTIGVGLQIR